MFYLKSKINFLSSDKQHSEKLFGNFLFIFSFIKSKPEATKNIIGKLHDSSHFLHCKIASKFVNFYKLCTACVRKPIKKIK